MASISPVAAVRTSSAATRRDSCGCVIVPGSTPRAARCGARSPGVRGRAARTAGDRPTHYAAPARSEEHTSELQSRLHLVCRLLLEKKKATEQHRDEITDTPKGNTAMTILLADPARPVLPLARLEPGARVPVFPPNDRSPAVAARRA